MKSLLPLLVAGAVACGGPPGAPRQPAKADTSPPSDKLPGLMTGLGAHHHPMTANAEAQRFFDQGFTLVYAFNHEEAARSFQRAAELDPTAAMPHWGIAWAVGPNYNADIDDARAKQAWNAIERAKSLGATAPAHERAYIDALAVRYSSDAKADRAALARRYSAAMGALMRQYPDDLDAATLYGESLMNLRPWQLWALDGTPAPGTEELMAVFESVLRRDPNHIGANHYYVHAVEASPTPARGLPSAGRLVTLAPAAGHLVHMPAHIYQRTGDYASAARANLAGAEADRVYLKAAPPDSFYGLAYYSHNLHFLADSHMMQGRFGDSQKAAAELAERLTPHADMMPMVESMAVAPMSVLLRFGRHAETLGLVAPPAERPVMTAWWHFARGVALARTAKLDAAARERADVDQTLAKIPESALFGGTGLASAKTILAIAGVVLDARLAWGRGEQARAVELWRQAVAAADRLPYDEPPIWFYPLRESLGAALILAGRPGEAERVFRDDLERYPRNPRSLFGLHESLVKQGKAVDAAWVQRLFEDAWRNADTMLTLEAM